jgi:hypothetical protein
LQLLVHDFFNPADPIPVLSFTWAPSIYDNFEVNYQTLTRELLVWEGVFDEDEFLVPWPATEADIRFTVVPSPPTGVLVALVIPCLWNRQRSIL